MALRYERIVHGARLSSYPVRSAALEGNPLGDPVERDCPLLVPDGGGEGLPLVIVLVGFTGFGHKVLNVSIFGENLPERIARLTAAGDLPPAVYLWPSCETRLGGSQYLNSTATGRYEDFLRDELVPEVESALGCGGSGRRVALGKSSGGYGALTLAMRNPGWLAAAASHAGDMGFEFGYWNELPNALNCWRRHGGPAAFLEALPGLARLGSLEHAGIDVLAMASCYSPDPDEELGFALPVDPRAGEPRPEVFERWLGHDPLRMVERDGHAGALRELRALYLDAGERDEFHLQWGLRRFTQRLERGGVPHHAAFFEGGHFDLDARFEHSLPLLLRAAAC